MSSLACSMRRARSASYQNLAPTRPAAKMGGTCSTPSWIVVRHAAKTPKSPSPACWKPPAAPRRWRRWRWAMSSGCWLPAPGPQNCVTNWRPLPRSSGRRTPPCRRTWMCSAEARRCGAWPSTAARCSFPGAEQAWSEPWAASKAAVVASWSRKKPDFRTDWRRPACTWAAPDYARANMSGYIDLHCHYVPGIDDGAKSAQEGVAMLRGLQGLGFAGVLATPHTRPGMFDNTAATISLAFEQFKSQLPTGEPLPELSVSSEHYFDEVVFQRLLTGQGLPYPGGKAVLLEFYQIDFPPMIRHRLFDLRTRGLLPVIAHPERYQCLWRSPDILETLVDSGAAAL